MEGAIMARGDIAGWVSLGMHFTYRYFADLDLVWSLLVPRKSGRNHYILDRVTLSLYGRRAEYYIHGGTHYLCGYSSVSVRLFHREGPQG